MNDKKREFKGVWIPSEIYLDKNKPPWVAGDQHEWSYNSAMNHVCNVCNGAKIIARPSQELTRLQSENSRLKEENESLNHDIGVALGDRDNLMEIGKSYMLELDRLKAERERVIETVIALRNMKKDHGLTAFNDFDHILSILNHKDGE